MYATKDISKFPIFKSGYFANDMDTKHIWTNKERLEKIFLQEGY